MAGLLLGVVIDLTVGPPPVATPLSAPEPMGDPLDSPPVTP